MDSREFAKSLEKQVADFCQNLDAKLPAYSFIPLTNDEMRIKVMQSRLFNEIRAGEIFGGDKLLPRPGVRDADYGEYLILE